MRQDAVRLQRIAQNLSNALTPGYKKQVASSQPFGAQFDAANAAGQPARAGASMASVQARLDPSAGTLRVTGSASDVAIDGDGFFELAHPSGAVYSRRGDFHVDANGRLVGALGLPVMGAGGEIRLTAEPFTIAANGDITQAGAVVAKLRTVRLARAELLEPVGGVYALGGATLEDVAAVPRLRIGYQENSNVDSAREMVGMTETVRHFESLQKLMQGYDEVLEKSIRKLGEF